MNILKLDPAFNRRHDDAIGIVFRRLLRMVNHIAEPLQGQRRFLHRLPDRGHAQQRAGDITGNDPEGDQLTEAEITTQDQRGSTPDHQQAGEFVEEGTEGVGRGAEQGVIKTLGDKIGVKILPFPATAQLDVLGFHRHHAAQHFDQVALGTGIGHRPTLNLGAHHRRHRQGEHHQHRNHRQGEQGELPAVDHHDDDIQQGEDRIENGGERRTGEKGANLLEFADTAAHFTHRAAIEIGERQAQQVINDLGAERQIDAVGGVNEQKRAQTEKQAFKDSKHHQQGAQHTKGTGAVVDDHLVNHLLNQQRIHQAEELHKETGQQHLQQHSPMLLQGRQKPAKSEFALRRELIDAQSEHFSFRAPLLAELLQAELLIADSGDADHQAIVVTAIDHRQAIPPAHQQRSVQTADRIGADLKQLGLQAQRFGHGTSQRQRGLAVALHLIGEHPSQQLPAEGQPELIAEHAECRDRRLQRADTAMPGVRGR